MEKEYNILKYLQEEEFTSQRKIAEGTGLSLGTVNIMLKKLVKKGLVKMERLNARSLRYIITPRGLAEKTRLTYSYVRQSYHYVLKISSVMDRIIELVDEHEMEGIFLFGPKNEVLEILKIPLEKSDVEYSVLTCEKDLPEPGGKVLVVWEIEDEERLSEYKPINVMKII